MLNVMRENLRHLKWLLWLVAASMTFYLGAFFFSDDRGGSRDDWVARVNGTEISANRCHEFKPHGDTEHHDEQSDRHRYPDDAGPSPAITNPVPYREPQHRSGRY